MTAPPSASPREAVAAELRALAGQLAEARRLLGEGRLVELADLEAHTRAVCEAARALPAEEGRSLRPDLEAMLYDLDALATDLTARFGPQARQDQGPADRRQKPTLAAAYRDNDRRTGGSTDEEA